MKANGTKHWVGLVVKAWHALGTKSLQINGIIILAIT